MLCFISEGALLLQLIAGELSAATHKLLPSHSTDQPNVSAERPTLVLPQPKHCLSDFCERQAVCICGGAIPVKELVSVEQHQEQQLWIVVQEEQGRAHREQTEQVYQSGVLRCPGCPRAIWC